jgi:hypothetical protein
MISNNLKFIENREIKNYVELCKILEVSVKTGTAKMAHLNELARYIQYRKIRNKYHFGDIYETPLDKNDKRSNGNNKIHFTNDIYKLILKYLDRHENNLVVSKTALLKELNMINSKYVYYKYNIPEMHDDYEISYSEIENFYTNSYSLFNRCLSNVIDMLGKKSLALVNDNFMISFKTGDNSGFIRLATDEEIKQILHCQKLALDYFNYDSLKDVIIHNNNFDKFNKLVIQYLQEEENEQIESYYKVLKFIVKKEDLYNVVMTLSNENEFELKQKLNNDICDRLQNNADKRYK